MAAPKVAIPHLSRRRRCPCSSASLLLPRSLLLWRSWSGRSPAVVDEACASTFGARSLLSLRLLLLRRLSSSRSPAVTNKAHYVDRLEEGGPFLPEAEGGEQRLGHGGVGVEPEAHVLPLHTAKSVSYWAR